jgi:hypothetical protein
MVILIAVCNYVQNVMVIVKLAMDPTNIIVCHVISQILEKFNLIIHVNVFHIFSISIQINSVHNAFIVVIHVMARNIINVYHVILKVFVRL